MTQRRRSWDHTCTGQALLGRWQRWSVSYFKSRSNMSFHCGLTSKRMERQSDSRTRDPTHLYPNYQQVSITRLDNRKSNHVTRLWVRPPDSPQHDPGDGGQQVQGLARLCKINIIDTVLHIPSSVQGHLFSSSGVDRTRFRAAPEHYCGR